MEAKPVNSVDTKTVPMMTISEKVIYSGLKRVEFCMNCSPLFHAIWKNMIIPVYHSQNLLRTGFPGLFPFSQREKCTHLKSMPSF